MKSSYISINSQDNTGKRRVTGAEAALPHGAQLGPVDSMKEVCRDARRVGWLEDLVRDIGQAGRSLWRSPAFAVTAIVTIALRYWGEYGRVQRHLHSLAGSLAVP